MRRIEILIARASAWVRNAFTPSPVAWHGAAFGLFLFWAILFLATGFDVLPHFTFEKIVGVMGLFAAMALASGALFLLVRAAASMPLRYRFALLLCTPPAVLYAASTWNAGGAAIVVPVMLLTVSLLFGAGASLIARHGKTRVGSVLFFLAGASLLLIAIVGYFKPPGDSNPALASYHLKGRTLDMPDPGKPGPFKVRFLTYGSGRDRHRPEYGAGVRIVTRPFDASKLDLQWTGLGGWLRSLYWGFNASVLPVQAQVWMPDGAGPFPLVLIVHGGHAMEEPSDPGYAYLGEHLASQGFIVASVDENFLNASLSDFADLLHLRFGAENNVRAVLLLEHLARWRAWNAERGSPFFRKVDMDRIALIGHSKGGETVATAFALNGLNRYPDDASISLNYRFNIRAIASIAGVDGEYRPRGDATRLQDVDYFGIQGSLDGDLPSFMPSAQFSRVTLSPGSGHFKATAYIKDANHGQFNTVWGRNDQPMPVEPFIDERPIMDGGAQRRIAKVYLSAFLQAALYGRDGYRPLFEDARNGAAWLPDTYIVNNYGDSDTRWLANYEEDIDPTTGSMPGVTIDGRNLTLWREGDPTLRIAHLDTHVALLAWDDRVHTHGAQYEVDFGHAAQRPGADQSLVFSVGDAMTPNGVRVPLDWTVVLIDESGSEARLTLSHDQVLYPQYRGDYLRLHELSAIAPSEIVLRRYRFRLRDFEAANPRLDLARLAAIRFDFDRSPRGMIALDDVGFAD